uniref:Alpha/beta hydrolase fold-3 domain-containing protein n=1 Tax=Araucaria cunninghamii TaxID=56994 RepID=A0A0D6QRE0_ARACU
MEGSKESVIVVAELPGLKLFSDGSFSRYELPDMSVTPSPEASLGEDKGVASKDMTLDNDLGLWVRIYLPPLGNEQHGTPIPVCLYFHGGAFCVGSASWKPFHALCIRVAAAAEAIVVSVNYRLAPEHRLPAAYDDCTAALSWLRSGGGGDPWIQRHADLSKLFLMGDSAGGNIVHHLVLGDAELNLRRAQMGGVVMVQPAFAGEARTPSEAESPEAMEESDLRRGLALPLGTNRDHPYLNPMASQSSELVNATLPPLLIVVGGRDIMRDRQREYYQGLRSYGKEVKTVEFEEEDHGFYAWKPDVESTELLIQEIARFVKNSS